MPEPPHMCHGCTPASYERMLFGWLMWASGWTLVVEGVAFSWPGAVERARR